MFSLSSRLPSTILAFGVLLCGLLAPGRAWAWAPMCDSTASTAIAPMVAPPVESGEIGGPCPFTLDGEDDVAPGLHSALSDEGHGPRPPGEEWTSHDSGRFPPTAGPPFDVATSRGLVSILPPVQVAGGPRVGFTRTIERPPCALIG